MESNPTEQRRGLIWLSIAGPVAIAFTFALYTVNNRLMESKGETVLGDTLRELRGAQTSIETGPFDARLRVVTNIDAQEAEAAAAAENGGHHEHDHDEDHDHDSAETTTD